MRLSAWALCALCLAAPANATINLIADGGFETNPAEHGGYTHIAGGASFDNGAWRVTGVDILHVDSDFHVGANPPMVFQAHGGRDSLDLTGTGNSGPGDGVYQDVATQAGTAYTLSFWVGRAMNNGSVGGDYLSDATVRLSIGGGAQLSFVNDDVITSGIAWKQFTASFVATGATTRIAFLNGLGNDYLGLDDVALTPSAVPETAVWALTVAGFGMLGGMLRRRPPQLGGAR
jgi:hypothetical protein